MEHGSTIIIFRIQLERFRGRNLLGRTAPVILFLVLIGILAEVDIQSVKAASQTHPVIGTSWIAMPSYKDAYVNSSSPDTNFGDDTRLYVGAHFFTFVAFNLSVVPSGAMIVSALMRLDLTWTPGSTFAYGVDTYYCSNSSWSESGITWNNMPTNPLEYTDNWHIPYWYGGGYKTFNVTKDVRTALSSGNLTEVLKLSGGNDVEEWGFGSREEKQRGTPSLEVEYAIEPIYVVQFESVAAGFPDNIGFVTITYQNRTYKDNSYNTTFANYTFMLPADIEIVSGGSLSVYYRGYVFVRWEASGDVVVSDANVSTTTLNVSGNGTLTAVGNADIMEYSYDCGTSAYGSYGDSGEIEALRFTPLCSGRLLFAHYYLEGLDWNSTDNRFKVHVMDENRSDIMIPFSARAARGRF